MITNFIKFSKYPWAAQCLEMRNTTGSSCTTWYRRDGFRRYIKRGEFLYALQRAESVGYWDRSPFGVDYWDDIRLTYFTEH